MSNIIYNAGKVKEYENLMAICEFAGESRAWGENLWADLLQNPDVYEEYLHYMIYHTLLGKVSVEGYNVLDLYVWQMELSNLRQDTGKNTADCNKDKLVLHALKTLLDMKMNPEEYLKKLNEGRGLDKY